MVQLKVVQDQRKQKTDLTYPIYFRLTELRKSIYLSTGFSVLKEHWDKEAGKVTKAHSNAAILNATLSKKYSEIQKAIIELDDQDRFTFHNIKEVLMPRTEVHTVQSFTNELIDQMLKQKKTGNAIVYRTALSMLSHYKPNVKLSFVDIDIRFLKNYQSFLIERGVKVNTISNYIRTLRAIYNKAVQSKVIERKFYPFENFNIKTEKTVKRSISKGDITKIESLNFENSRQLQQAKDVFLLSFYLIGISFTDLVYLTKENIINGRLVYRRRKTGKLYSIKLFPKAQRIINHYQNKHNKYLLSLIPDLVIEDSIEAKKLIYQCLKTTNKYLARIGKDIPLEIKITTYVARHTFATVSKNLGYSNEMIAEALGHEYGNRITAIYLDAFDKKEIDKMHSIVIK